MVTIEDIKQMITEETQKLNKIGYSPVEVKTIKLVKASSFFADAWRTQGKIRVSSYYLEAPVEQIRATIMHELIHMIPESGRGHGSEWKAIAAKVNKAYPQYNIRRIGSNLAGQEDAFSVRRAAQLEKAAKHVKLHIVKCKKCGCKFARQKESNLTLHPEQYHCNCGGSLVRIC